MKSRLFFTKRPSQFMAVLISLALVFGSTCSAWAGLPPSLKTVATPEPVNLGLFLNNTGVLNAQGFPVPTQAAKDAAIALGKALFWDMQVGSDGQACASCHFNAGADTRTRNQINPGLNGGDSTFQVRTPAQFVRAIDFPFAQPTNTDQPVSAANPLVRNFNDVMSSQGVFNTLFADIVLGANAGPGFPDLGNFAADPVFHIGVRNTRRVEPRNTPTTINAVFNFSNFWDGRARNIFNGVNPFGELDPDAAIFVNDAVPGTLTPETVRIPDASLASQAVGPPLSPFEMSFDGRTFPDLGQKMLQAFLQPLAGQQVAADDSVFGLPNALGVNLVDPVSGLKSGVDNPVTSGENLYATLIKLAFQPRYWDSPAVVSLPTTAGPQFYTQMEANFSLFWGLAVQMYEATLRSDDSKFDKFREGTATLTATEKDGMNIFFSGGTSCATCHAGPEFTNHSVANIRGGAAATPPFFLPANAIEVAAAQVTPTNPTNKALFDNNFYNITVRPTPEDLGRGGNAPTVNPITGQPYPLSFSRLALLNAAGQLPAAVANFVPNLPGGAPTRVAVDGGFKVPSLRNVELTGPFMHNGSMSTLRQVVQFYARGGNFRDQNLDNIDADFRDSIGQLVNSPNKQNNLARFLVTLTDNRVKIQSAPFDHPALFIPSGNGLKRSTGVITETLTTLPATGRNGDAANPLQSFLNLPQTKP